MARRHPVDVEAYIEPDFAFAKFFLKDAVSIHRVIKLATGPLLWFG
jgi:hypothetical protein